VCPVVCRGRRAENGSFCTSVGTGIRGRGDNERKEGCQCRDGRHAKPASPKVLAASQATGQQVDAIVVTDVTVGKSTRDAAMGWIGNEDATATRSSRDRLADREIDVAQPEAGRWLPSSLFALVQCRQSASGLMPLLPSSRDVMKDRRMRSRQQSARVCFVCRCRLPVRVRVRLRVPACAS
jgi:hypothetical protein